MSSVIVNFDLDNEEKEVNNIKWVYLVATFLYKNSVTGRDRHQTINLSYRLDKAIKENITREKLIDATKKLIELGVINNDVLDESRKRDIKAMIQKWAKKDPKKLKSKEYLPVTYFESSTNIPDRFFDPVVSLNSKTETGVTTLIGGSSFTGKTYFLVNEINKLFKNDYDLIILMTESKNADDIKRIRSELNVVIIEGFKPDIIEKLKRINDKCNNKFRFLVILDDIVDQKNNKILSKMILTFRNANISTVILIQYLRLINKASRGSFHQVILTGFRSQEDYETAMDIFDLGAFAREMMEKELNGQRKAHNFKKYEVSQWLKKRLGDKNTKIYIDQKHNKDPVIFKHF